MLARYKIGWDYVLLVVIVAVGLAARLYDVHYSFDADEVFSVKLASKQFSEVIFASLQDRPHPPLHNVLLHLWIKAFGASEVAVRILSVLFSGAFLVVSYALLRQFVVRWLAFALLSILALSPVFVYYGQQARPYALIAFLSTANVLAFIRVFDVPHDRKRNAIWALSCALLLYAQYLAILFIAFQMVFALILLRSERLTILAYGSVGSVLILPWLIAAVGKVVLGGTDPLHHISWMGPPSLASLGWFYVSVFGVIADLQTRWLLLILALLGATYIIHYTFFARSSLPTSHMFLFLISIGVPLIVYVVSVWGPKPIFANRQLLGAATAFVTAIGLCIAILPRTWAVGSSLILLSWTATALFHEPFHITPPWRDIAQDIDRQYGSVAIVTQEGVVSMPLDFYRKLGPILPWSEFMEIKEDYRFLFVCRPVLFKCSDIEIDALKSRRFLLTTWRWGSEASEYNQLRLYEIKGITN